MRLTDILTEARVIADLHGQDKAGVLRELAEVLCQHTPGLPLSAEQVHHALSDRERLGSTGVGEGVAIPHAKLDGTVQLVACFGRSRAGVAFDAIDGQPVHLFFVLLVPENSAGTHLKALARVSRLLKNAAFRQSLLTLPDNAALFNAFVTADSEQ